MSHRRSEEKRTLSGPLQDISHRQLAGLTRVDHPPSASKVELSSYIEENHHLRLKCAKIDEIENCANILMQNIEKYKRWNAELEDKVAELMRDNDKLRNEVSHGLNLKLLKEENFRKEGEMTALRKKMEINDNLQLKRIEQELSAEKQARERMIATLEGKHKADISKLEHQLKLALNKAEHQNQMLRSQTENLVKESAIIKSNLNNAEGEVRKLIRENDQLQQELVRSQDMLVRSEDELGGLSHKYSELKLGSDQRIAALTVELDRLRAEFEKSLSMQAMLERMNAQLKNEGGVLILENEDMKARSLELEEMNLINLTTIKNLHDKIASMTDSNSYFEAKMVDKEMANKQMLDELERNNLLQRKSIQELETQILTKRKEIDDLIMIVSKLEADLQVATASVAALEQTNAGLLQQLKERQENIDVQTMQISTLLAKVQELQAYKTETQALLDTKEGAEKQLIQEKQKNTDLQNELELEKNRLEEMQILKEQLRGELVEREKISKSWKDGKEQYERMYAQEKAEIPLYQQRIAELEKLAAKLEEMVHAGEEERARMQAAFEEEKASLAKEGMEQMEQLISAKYDQILKEYQRHYDQQIRAMEDQIKSLKDQISSSAP